MPNRFISEATRGPNSSFNRGVNARDSGMKAYIFLFRAVSGRSSVLEQPERFPGRGQNCQAQTAKKRYHRTLETLQATINGPGKDGEPEHKERYNQEGAPGSLLLVQFGVNEANEPLPLQDAGGGYEGSGGKHCRIAPS